MKKICFYLFAISVLYACNSESSEDKKEVSDTDKVSIDVVEERQNQLKQTVQDYFAAYKKHQNIEELMSFYAENAILDDVLYGKTLEGKEEIRNYLNWGSEELMFDSTQAFLNIKTIAIGQNTASVEGNFAPFIYKGEQQNAWRFTTWLTFNEANKIVLHVDYIKYPLSILEESADSE